MFCGITIKNKHEQILKLVSLGMAVYLVHFYKNRQLVTLLSMISCPLSSSGRQLCYLNEVLSFN